MRTKEDFIKAARDEFERCLAQEIEWRETSVDVSFDYEEEDDAFASVAFWCEKIK